MVNKIRIINFDKYLENWINSYNKQFDDELKIANYKSISFCTKNKAYHSYLVNLHYVSLNLLSMLNKEMVNFSRSVKLSAMCIDVDIYG